MIWNLGSDNMGWGASWMGRFGKNKDTWDHMGHAATICKQVRRQLTQFKPQHRSTLVSSGLMAPHWQKRLQARNWRFRLLPSSNAHRHCSQHWGNISKDYARDPAPTFPWNSWLFVVTRPLNERNEPRKNVGGPRKILHSFVRLVGPCTLRNLVPPILNAMVYKLSQYWHNSHPEDPDLHKPPPTSSYQLNLR